MQKNEETLLNPSHSAPVSRLRLEVVNLKNSGVEGLVGGSFGTAASLFCAGTVGSFADEE